MSKKIKFSRRKFMKFMAKSGLGAAALTSAPMLNHNFLYNSAFAASGKPLIFAAAEALTGNWDPTTHTNLGQLIFESYVFGYLTRCPMKPENPTQLNFELATEATEIDKFTLEFKLRDGVTFHNGKPFGAEDVKATYEYGSQPDRPAQWYPGQVDVEVVDRLTVRIKTEKYGYPAGLFYYLSSFLPILSADDVANPNNAASRPNGTGAFKFVEQDGDNTIMEANENFFMGKPKIPRVQYNFVGDTATRTLGLLSGEYNVTERLEPEQVDTIVANGGFALNQAVSTENKYLWFRCSKPPFNDINMRKAVAHAIDREGLLDILGISGTYTGCHVSPVKFGYTDVEGFPDYNPDKCQEYLAKAGFPKGKGLPELEYITSVGFYPKTKEYGEYITALLNEQGIPVKLSVLELGAWGNKLYDREGGGPGHMIDCGWCTGSPEPDLVIRTHFHSSSKRITGIVDADIDAALDKERNAPSVGEREQILKTEVMPLLVDKMPSVPLFGSVFIHAMANDIKDLYIYPNGMMSAETASIG